MRRSAILNVFLIIVFMLNFSFFFYSEPLPGEEVLTGCLTGIVYEFNEETPIKDAVVLIRNITTFEEFKSNITEKDGEYFIQNITPGVYIIGVSIISENKQERAKIGVIDYEDLNYEEKYSVNAMVKINSAEISKCNIILTRKRACLAGFFPLPCRVATIGAVGATFVIFTQLQEAKPPVSPITLKGKK